MGSRNDDVGATERSDFRVALIDDHDIVARGFAEVFTRFEGIQVVATVATVGELLMLDERLDLVILDLRLGDDSDPEENVRRLRASGAEVLAFTGGEDPVLVRAAAHGGALGVIRKSEPTSVLQDAVSRAARGEMVASTEWAAALDSDPRLVDAGLSPRERQVLSLYASGAKTQLVATQTYLSESTVLDYIRRVRHKYDTVGRPANTKVDLYKRALEDGILPVPGRR